MRRPYRFRPSEFSRSGEDCQIDAEVSESTGRRTQKYIPGQSISVADKGIQALLPATFGVNTRSGPNSNESAYNFTAADVSTH